MTLNYWDRKQNRLNNFAATRADWRKAEAFAKTTIVLNLGPVVKVRLRAYIDPDYDEEKTAKEFWNFLMETYTETNSHAVQNVRNELKVLTYVDGKDWGQTSQQV